MRDFDQQEIPTIVGGRRRRGFPREETMNTDEIPLAGYSEGGYVSEPHPSTYYRRPRPQDLEKETVSELRARHMAMMQLMLMWLASIIGGLMMLGGAVRTVMWVIS